MPEPTRDEIHALYVTALGRVAGLSPGGAFERVGPFLCIDAGLGVSEFNIAVAVEPVRNPRDDLRAAIRWFGERGINLRLDLRGSADSTLLAAATVEGFTFKFREPVMTLYPLPGFYPAPGSLRIVEVVDETGTELYCEVDREEYNDQDFQRALVQQARQMDGVRLFVGMAGDRPVARSMGIVAETLVSVHNVYVAPSQRRQGFGRAMTAAVIEAVRPLGVDAACLEATTEGFPLYESMGFRRVDDYVVVGTEGPMLP